MSDIFSIWYYNPDEPNIHRYRETALSLEHVIFYPKEQALDGMSVHQLLAQLMLDFHRQSLHINGTPCTDIMQFLRYLTEKLKTLTELRLSLLMCQQTVMAIVLIELQLLLRNNRILGIIAESSKKMDIMIEDSNGEMLIRVHKLLRLVEDTSYPPITRMLIEIECVSESPQESNLQFYLKFIPQ